MSETWLKKLVQAAVTTLAAASDLTALLGKIGTAPSIEPGLWLPRKTIDIPQGQRPYIGVSFAGYTADLPKVPGSAVGMSTHDVTLRCDIQHAAGKLETAQERIEDIIAQLAITVGRQRVANPLGLNETNAKTCDLFPGSGAPTLVQEPDDESDSWCVEGEYVFTVRVRLLLFP